MRYLGSKEKLKKYIIPILCAAMDDKHQQFVDVCCGGCSIVSSMPTDNKIAIDRNEYVISLWQKLQRNKLNGYLMDGIPFDITRDQYNSIKDSYINKDCRWPDYVIGYIGSAGSFGGAWFNGYSAPNYNKRNSKGEPENHYNESYRGLEKQLHSFEYLETTVFVNMSFLDFTPTTGSVIYADPPYAGTKKYKDDFPHEDFYDWCRRMNELGHKVFISEYNMPDDFTCIWEKEKVCGLGTVTGRNQNVKNEKLFTLLKK